MFLVSTSDCSAISTVPKSKQRQKTHVKQSSETVCSIYTREIRNVFFPTGSVLFKCYVFLPLLHSSRPEREVFAIFHQLISDGYSAYCHQVDEKMVWYDLLLILHWFPFVIWFFYPLPPSFAFVFVKTFSCYPLLLYRCSTVRWCKA